jgi:hypothetical protein
MTETYASVDELSRAFPASIRHDALQACAAIPGAKAFGIGFSVKVAGELVTILDRLHFDPASVRVDGLSPLQRELFDCLLTRHSDGLVREYYLPCVISRRRIWIPPLIVRLAGEYVIEILNVIYRTCRGWILPSTVNSFAITLSSWIWSLRGSQATGIATIEAKLEKNTLASRFLNSSEDCSTLKKQLPDDFCLAGS